MDSFLSNEFKERASSKKLLQLCHVDKWLEEIIEGHQTSMDSEGEIGMMVQLDINKKAKVFAVKKAMSPSFILELDKYNGKCTSHEV